MKKKGNKTGRKRFFAMLLSICMMATLLPANSVRAEEAESGSGTAAETVSYEAIEGTGGYDGEDYANLVDGDTSNKWCLNFSNEAYIIFQASLPLRVTGYSMTTGEDTGYNPERNPKSWTLYGANEKLGKDADGWKELDAVTDDTELKSESTATTNYTLKTAADNKYTYFMLKISAIRGGSTMQLAEFALEYTLCDHIWERTDKTTASDCTQPGEIIWRCSKCQAEKTVIDETRPAVGHRFVGERCNRCGAVEKRKPMGEGTIESPYQIGKVSELYWFAGLVNGDEDVCTGEVEQNTGACAVLTADITVNAGLLDQDGNLTSRTEGLLEWTPIGRDEASAYAEGATFDGQGHYIRGVYCNWPDRESSGLFGYNKGSMILTLKTATMDHIFIMKKGMTLSISLQKRLLVAGWHIFYSRQRSLMEKRRTLSGDRICPKTVIPVRCLIRKEADRSIRRRAVSPIVMIRQIREERRSMQH